MVRRLMRVRRRRRIISRHKLPIRVDIHHPPTHLVLHPLHPIHTVTHPHTTTTHVQPESHPGAHHLHRGHGVGVIGSDVVRLLLLLRCVLHISLLLLLLLLLMVLHGVIIRLLLMLLLLERHPILLLLHMPLHLMRRSRRWSMQGRQPRSRRHPRRRRRRRRR